MTCGAHAPSNNESGGVEIDPQCARHPDLAPDALRLPAPWIAAQLRDSLLAAEGSLDASVVGSPEAAPPPAPRTLMGRRLHSRAIRVVIAGLKM